MSDTPSIQAERFAPITTESLLPDTGSSHSRRFLILYGSLREPSFSRFSAEEAGRVLTRYGAEVRLFDPSGLPQVGDCEPDHPKVAELRELVL